MRRHKQDQITRTSLLPRPYPWGSAIYWALWRAMAVLGMTVWAAWLFWTLARA